MPQSKTINIEDYDSQAERNTPESTFRPRRTVTPTPIFDTLRIDSPQHYKNNIAQRKR